VQRVALEVYMEAANAIKARYDENGEPDPGYPPYTLNGIIFHMMRTGSTLWGNSKCATFEPASASVLHTTHLQCYPGPEMCLSTPNHMYS